MPRSRRLDATDARIIALTVALKVAVVVVGALAATLGSGPPTVGPLDPWAAWDTNHYTDIAVFGYVAEDPGTLIGPYGYRQAYPGSADRNIVFLPLYPWLVGVVSFLTRSPLAAAFVVSGAASLLVGPLLRRLVSAELGDQLAARATVFLLLFPTAFFLHIGYTESLFLALALASLLLARRRRWWLAGGLAALAAFTRVNGIALGPALAAEAFLQWRADPDRARRPEWLAIGGVGVGFGAYLLVNLAVYGDPLMFVQIQRDYWYKQFAPPWEGLMTAFHWIVSTPPGAYASSSSREAQALELAFAALGLVGTLACAWLRLRLTWTAWMASSWLLFVSSGFLMSVPRFTLVMFPLFAIFALVTHRRPGVAAVVAGCSFAGFLVLAWRFASRLWAF